MTATRMMKRVSSAWALLAVAVLTLTGCGTQCLRHSDCPNQLVCGPSGACELPPEPDAAPDNATNVPHSPDFDALPPELVPDAGIDAESIDAEGI